MFGKFVISFLRSRGFDLVPIRKDASGNQIVIKPIDPMGVEILGEPGFQNSCSEIYNLTLLDTPRLANLWQLSRLTDPKGNLLEVGSYRGGSALHLSNANPMRKLFVCDSFEGFEKLDPKLDRVFHQKMFKDTSKEKVEQLFAGRGRNVQVVKGYFPESVQGLDLQPLSFVHLDLDTYDGTKACLAYLASRMMPRSLIVLDDFQRTAHGVDEALKEFLADRTDWTLMPLFPSQALLIPNTWWTKAAGNL